MFCCKSPCGTMEASMKLAYAIFYSHDLERIKMFYEKTLGFSCVFGDERFIAFAIGDRLLGIKKADIEREVPGHQTVILEVEGVETLFDRATQKQWNIFSPLKNEAWGKNFSILDPDGNRVEFFSA